MSSLQLTSFDNSLSKIQSQITCGPTKLSVGTLYTCAPSCKIYLTELKKSLNLTDTNIFIIVDNEEFLVDQLLKDSRELKLIKISRILHTVTATVPYFGTCLVDLIINYL